MSHWVTLVLPWRLHPINARGQGHTSRTPGGQGNNEPENTSSPCPPVPHSIPVQGHHATVLQGQEHHGGRGIYRCRPKIEIELQSGEDRGDPAGAVWSREMVWDRVGDRLESFQGWLAWHPSPHSGELENLGLRHRGGSAFETSSESQPSPGPTRDGQTLVGGGVDKEPLLGHGLVLGA